MPLWDGNEVMSFKKSTLCLALCGSALLMASCTTTGDPRSGGIFWSAEKAQARQDALRMQESASLEATTAAEKRTAALKSQIAKLKAEIAEKKRQLSICESDIEAAALRSEIAMLENELRQLQSI